MTSSSLHLRMKSYEALNRAVLPARNFHVLRVDGKNFSTYTRGLLRPYDEVFMADMDALTRELTASVSGAILGFTQSDEASVVFSDLAGDRTEPHLGGSVNKITSLSAALATAVFNERRPGKRALFDARVFSVPAAEVVNYLLDRQRDTTKNAITMAASVEFSPRQLDGQNSTERLRMLEGRGVDFSEFPAGFRLGRLTTKSASEEPVTFTDGRTREQTTKVVLRTRWVTEPAPAFVDGLPLELPLPDPTKEVPHHVF